MDRHDRRIRNRRAALSALTATLLTLAAGCAGASPAAVAPTATAPTVTPPDAQIYTGPADPGPTDTSCLGSLRPTGPLPAPGDPAAGSTVAAIRARSGADRALVVGVDQTTLDWGYLPAGAPHPEGFDVDTLVRVARAIFGGDPVTDGTIRFVVVPNAQRQSAVHAGTVDLLAETMTVTCDRKTGANAVDFSSVYFVTGQGILAPKEVTIQTLADLAGKRVCATAGSTSVRKLAAIPGVIPWEAATQTDCLVMLQQGQVDAISTDLTILAGLAKQDPSLEIKTGTDNQPITLRDEQYGMAIAPEKPDFVRYVNAVLAQDRTDPSGWAARYRTWLCPDGPNTCPAPAAPVATYRD